MIRAAMALAAFAATIPAQALPPPPPPPAVVAAEQAFFEALPQFMPGEHSDALKAMIAEDLVVTLDDGTTITGRDAWLAWRAGLAGGRVERFQMLRTKFWRDRLGRIVVEEFWMATAKDIVFHADRPHQLVAYTFKDGLLTRVDHIIALDSVGYLGTAKPD